MSRLSSGWVAWSLPILKASTPSSPDSHAQPRQSRPPTLNSEEPSTLPVALIAGLGLASSLAMNEAAARGKACATVRDLGVAALRKIGAHLNGDIEHMATNTLNFSVPGVDSEAAIVALKDIVAISNGSACTSQSYEPSHVLTAARFDEDQIAGALRLSWSHTTSEVPWTEITRRLAALSAS